MNKTEYTRSKDKRRSENEVIFKQTLVNTVDSSFSSSWSHFWRFFSISILIGRPMEPWHLHYCLYNNQISFRTVPKYVPKMGMRNAKILSSQQLNKQTWPSTRPLWWNFWIFIIKFPFWKANSKSEWYSGWLDDRGSLSASVFASAFDDYIDVGDRCWRRNVLATNLRRWLPFWPFMSSTSSTFEH